MMISNERHPLKSTQSEHGSRHLSRRALLVGGSALAIGGERADAQSTLAAGRRVDVHHHILPPAYVAAVGEARIGAPAPMLRAPKWSVQESLDVMDRHGIATAVTSVSTPGFWFGDKAAAGALAREYNEFNARMMADHKGRFGMFASLPLPDVDGALREIAYAFDVLGADGVSLHSNYGAAYLGDPAFAPVLDELDRRQAVIHLHPAGSGCDQCMGDLKVPASVIEYPFQTTRAVVSLLYGGVMARCPNLRVILAHAGGTLPYLATKIGNLANIDTRFKDAAPPGTTMKELRRFFLDTALSANEVSLHAAREFAGVDRIVFGTDFPFGPEATTAATVRGIGASGFTPAEAFAIERGSAEALFPQLREK